MIKDLLDYLSSHGFSCKQLNNVIDCGRNDGLAFKIILRDSDKLVQLSPEGHEEELSSIDDVEELTIEYQGLLSDIKTILYKHGYRVRDEVSIFLEELVS